MDCIEGLKQLPDKSIDLCLTDPPWNVDFKQLSKRTYIKGRVLKPKDHKIHYKDDYSDSWTLSWFKEVRRVCNIVIVVMAQSKLIWWVKNTEPRGICIIYFKNGCNPSKISDHNRYTPYLVYSDETIKHKMFSNVIEYVIPWGFLSTDKWIHPSPKGTKIAKSLYKDMKPKSILDPFAGSGSYLGAAEAIGIPWLGFELMEAYKPDIDKRIALGKKEFNKPKQRSLW
jgi:site-specific DNA-methyltransferase (adenine-specific)